MLDWIAAIFELLGSWLIGSKRKIGFICFLMCNFLWIAYILVSGTTYGLLLVVIPSIGINIRNFIKWSKGDCV